ncbi:hypothetical protein [Herbiconiux liukaitaii]|uniref:hypothetical protein n=1 Tax=Herbiconiux liukaitaii TaxID=3342799 RepID=UPI0035BB9A22
MNEFRKLELGLLFSIVVGPDISEMNAELRGRFAVNQPHQVRLHLVAAATTAFTVDPNSRRGALFEALAADDAYCLGGYTSTAPIRFPS